MDNEKLTLWQTGRKTLVSVAGGDFIEGLVDGAFVISGLHGIENPIEIPVTYDLAGYRARSLRYLDTGAGEARAVRRAKTKPLRLNCTKRVLKIRPQTP